MNIFQHIKRFWKLRKRSLKLGEAATSDLSFRKFQMEKLKELNGDLDWNAVESVYHIGQCAATSELLSDLTSCILNGDLNDLAKWNNSIPFESDELGEIPVGDFFETILFLRKNSNAKVQILRGSFSNGTKAIVSEFDLQLVNARSISHRKLIYPV